MSEVETVLAWAVREASTNVVRHSDARACAITTLESDAKTVSLQVDDDGAIASGGARTARAWRGSASGRNGCTATSRPVRVPMEGSDYG